MLIKLILTWVFGTANELQFTVHTLEPKVLAKIFAYREANKSLTVRQTTCSLLLLHYPHQRRFPAFKTRFAFLHNPIELFQTMVTAVRLSDYSTFFARTWGRNTNCGQNHIPLFEFLLQHRVKHLGILRTSECQV